MIQTKDNCHRCTPIISNLDRKNEKKKTKNQHFPSLRRGLMDPLLELAVGGVLGKKMVPPASRTFWEHGAREHLMVVVK